AGLGRGQAGDRINNSIRKVTAATGIISTYAGTGDRGFSGDGGPATAARLLEPEAVALDAAGNLHIADNGNSRIRKVTAATSIISTYAGTGGRPGFSGDGGSATAATLCGPGGLTFDAAGNLYIADSVN